MDTSNPAPLLMLGGGLVIVLGTFLKWSGGFGEDLSGLNTDLNGLFGILALLIGAGLAAIGGIRAFAPTTKLPESIAGFSLDQIAATEAFTVFLWSFALVAEDGVKIGAHITWIGGIVALVGAVMSMRNGAASSATGPTSF